MELMNNWILERKPGHPPVYRLDIPNYTNGTIVLGNPGLVDPEAWMEDVRTSRAMPGWSGVINYYDTDSKPQQRTLVGYYQFAFPPESSLAGVWRLEGLDGFGVGTRLVLKNNVTNRHFNSTLDNPVYKGNHTFGEDEFEIAPTLAELLLEAEITPVFQITLLANSGFYLQPKPVTLLEILNVGCKLNFTFNGEMFHFVVAGNQPNSQIALQPSCQSCLIVNVQIVVNGVNHSLMLQTINKALPSINTSGGWNLWDGEWQDFANDLECYIGYLVMGHSRATIVTNLTVHQVSTQSHAMNVAKAMSLSCALDDNLAI